MFRLRSSSLVLPMMDLLFSWLLFMPLCSIILGIFQVGLVSCERLSDQKVCQEDEMALLLQLKNTLQFNPSVSTKLVSWNQSADCCSWGGVTWDPSGLVFGLDLSNESISDGFNSSSSLFRLRYLRSLNLADNSFSSSQIPSGFGKLGNLTYLNLSEAGFSGQIPIEISRLTRLVTIDISSRLSYINEMPTLKLENPNLRLLVQNLKEVREIHLSGVNLSSSGEEWSDALSSSVPNLQVLSLSSCFLSGPIHSSLQKLQSLSRIRLDDNNFSTPVPEFFANFPNLTHLQLSSCQLKGKFPEKILQVPTLQLLDFSNNRNLEDSLPDFPQNGSLETLLLSDTKLWGKLPDSMGNLKKLTRIELARCNFSGSIPSSVAKLPQLHYLDLSENKFSGPIPSFSLSRNLTQINLSYNNLEGPFPLRWETLVNLEIIELQYNSITGSLPPSLFSLPSLQKIQLSNNQFSGQFSFFSNAPSSMLGALDLSSNNLEGSIPESVFDLQHLSLLDLSSNRFNGTMELSNFQKLGHLTTLGLSHNFLSINIGLSDQTSRLLPPLTTLKLASCNLRALPDLRNQSRLTHLDLSDNQIHGTIPNWIWKIGNGSLMYLNLSHNLFKDLEEPLSNLPPYMSILDLHSNQLHGRIPNPPPSSSYVDYSDNNFNYSIPDDIGTYIFFAIFFSLSKNNISGIMPASICNASYLQVLDFSDNALSGRMPSCLIENPVLVVLNLRRNKFSGTISGEFPGNCSLQTLDLNENLLEGKIPESLANCRVLEVLNLGNNQMNDFFPCILKTVSSLRILVLRSNRFHGGIACPHGNPAWPMLQIIDLAYNNFSGELSEKYFVRWKAMKGGEEEGQLGLNQLKFRVLQFDELYYQDAVTLTSKGFEMQLVKIFTIFTAIDLSCNNFQGGIPESMEGLTSLHVLNLSYNAFTGQIPSSVGKLRQLESLDLSHNNLSGEIPTQLASLNFLSFLNLSFNQLEGKIPTGSQLQTFPESSYKGNKRLWGPPLMSDRGDARASRPTSQETHSDSRKEVKWRYIAAEIGYFTGLGITIGPLLLWMRWRQSYYKHVDGVLFRILPHHGRGRG